MLSPNYTDSNWQAKLNPTSLFACIVLFSTFAASLHLIYFKMK